MARLISQEWDGHTLYKWHEDVGEDGVARIVTEQVVDVEPILEDNKRQYNDAEKGAPKGFGRCVARYDGVTLQKVAKANGLSFREFVLARTEKARRVWSGLLSDPAFRYFRTAPGKVDIGRGVDGA